MIKTVSIITFMIFALLAAGCSPAQGSGELVVYSARSERFVQPLIDKFQEETGIRVRLLSGSEALVNKILEEKNNVQSDVFFSNDAGAMEFLRLEGALMSNDSPALEVIDPKFRAQDGSWVGLSARTRVLMFNRDLISEDEMPAGLRQLAGPEWKGQFMITRGGNSSMVTHIAALRMAWGDEKTIEWIKAVKENAGAIVGGHTDIRTAVGAGEFKFGLVNNYYYHLQLNEASDNNVGVIYPDQGEGRMGAFVNVAGIALIEGAPNVENAKAFIDWLLEPEQQKIFAYNSREVPLNPEAETAPEARPITDYQVMDISLQDLGLLWIDAKQLIEQAGLDLDI
ncbi:MAG: extracellular solute-binding protein [Actinomycetota bacterium]